MGSITQEQITKPTQRAEPYGTGHRLSELRKRTGVTQVELAKLLGIGQPRVSAIERGEIDTLTVASLRAYIAGLGGTVQLTVRINDSDVALELPRNL